MRTPAPILTPTTSTADSSEQATRPLQINRPFDTAPPWLPSVLDRLTEGVLVTDAALDPPGPRIVYVNDAICRLTGYPCEDLIGESPLIFLGPDTNPTETARLREDIGSGREYRGALRHYRRGGSSFLAEWIVSPIRDSEERITHFVMLVRDLTISAAPPRCCDTPTTTSSAA